ncbi:hypothetical protein NX059_007786 [Plenodomus lindquistii]|nr:hypothetical protein NX059_007786 [Plenodomus lindquistii]
MQTGYGPETELATRYTFISHDFDFDDYSEDPPTLQTDYVEDTDHVHDSDHDMILWVRVADILEIQCFGTNEGSLVSWGPTEQDSILYYSSATHESSLHARLNGTCLGDVVTCIYEASNQEHNIPENVRAFNRRSSQEDRVTSDEELTGSDTNFLDYAEDDTEGHHMDMDITWGDEFEESITDGATEAIDWQTPSAIHGIKLVNPFPPDIEDEVLGRIEGAPLSWRMFGSNIEVRHAELGSAVVYDSTRSVDSFLEDCVRDIPLGVILAHIYRQTGKEYRMPHVLHDFLDDVAAVSVSVPDARGPTDRGAENRYIVGDNADIPPLNFSRISSTSSEYSEVSEGHMVDLDDDVWFSVLRSVSDSHDNENSQSPHASDIPQTLYLTAYGHTSPMSSYNTTALGGPYDVDFGYSPHSPSFQVTSPGYWNAEDELSNTSAFRAASPGNWDFEDEPQDTTYTDASPNMYLRSGSPISLSLSSSSRSDNERRQSQEAGIAAASPPPLSERRLPTQYSVYDRVAETQRTRSMNNHTAHAPLAPHSYSTPVYLRSIEDFTTNHVIPLFPCHPLYPAPGTTCAICYEPFHDAHTPVAIVNVEGCKGHMFGYQCLRQNLSAGTLASNKCPMCRTMWFGASRGEIAHVEEEWRDVGEAEGRALANSEMDV